MFLFLNYYQHIETMNNGVRVCLSIHYGSQQFILLNSRTVVLRLCFESDHITGGQPVWGTFANTHVESLNTVLGHS